MSGGSVYVYNSAAGQGGQVPRFWTSPVEQAYAHLQALLAAEYDTNPLIEDVTTSGCMTVFAEPLIREVTDKTSVANLIAAGYTEAADQTCQEDAIAAQGAWAHTHSSIALNPYQAISGSGSVSIDEAFTQTLMAYCHSTLGNRCTLGNNSIRTASLGTQYNQMYTSMKGTGPHPLLPDRAGETGGQPSEHRVLGHRRGRQRRRAAQRLPDPADHDPDEGGRPGAHRQHPVARGDRHARATGHDRQLTGLF